MKKNFIAGMLTGMIISLFLACVILCFNIVFGGHGARKASTIVKQNVEEASKENKEKKEKKPVSDNSSDTTLEAKEGTSANDGYVLENSMVSKKMMVLEDAIDKYYIDPVNNEALEEGIYDGIMSALKDPYAAYYTAAEYESIMNSTEGIYFGIGAYLQLDTEKLYPKITGIIDGSPAEDSKLAADDYIVKVNGTDVYGMELSETVALIKGEEGTEVTLSIVRPSTGEQFDETLVRAKVESPTVNYEMLDNNIAYIQIEEFDAVTVDQFKNALDTAEKDKMKALILDLRGNPGGSLSAAVNIARLILPKGMIVYTEDKYGQRDEYKSDGKNKIKVPLAVLIDGSSASASEILAGAIKDYGIGTLIGTKTFGKGIVQRIIGLNDGSAIKMTISHYYTPLGNDIHKVGIEPDLEVEFDSKAYIADPENDNQINAAYDFLMKKIK